MVCKLVLFVNSKGMEYSHLSPEIRKSVMREVTAETY